MLSRVYRALPYVCSFNGFCWTLGGLALVALVLVNTQHDWVASFFVKW